MVESTADQRAERKVALWVDRTVGWMVDQMVELTVVPKAES